MSLYYKEYSLAVGANDQNIIYVDATSFALLSGANGLTIAVNDLDVSTILVGMQFELSSGDKIRKVTIANTTGAIINVKFAVSEGIIKDNRATFVGAVPTITGSSISTPASVTAGAAATLLTAANTARNEIHIQNTHASDNLYIGDANVGNDAAPRGIRILPNGVYILSAGASAYYVRRGGSNDIVVTTLEVS